MLMLLAPIVESLQNMPFTSHLTWDNGDNGSQHGWWQRPNISPTAIRMENGKPRKPLRTYSAPFTANRKHAFTLALRKSWPFPAPFRNARNKGIQLQFNTANISKGANFAQDPVINQEAEASKLSAQNPPSYGDVLVPRISRPEGAATTTTVPSPKIVDIQESAVPYAADVHVSSALDASVETTDQPRQSTPSFGSDNLEMDLHATGSQPRNHNEEDIASFNNEWRRLSDRRINKLSLQAKIHEIRRMLREKQNTKAGLEDTLIQHIRLQQLAAASNSIPPRTENDILDIVEKFQLARDAYGPLEDECNQLESELSREEFDIHRQEEAFYQRWDFLPISRHKVHDEQTPQRDPSSATQSTSDEEEHPHHPLVEKYLDRKGDLELLQEQVVNIRDERDALEGQRESRQLVGLLLASDEQNWLDESQEIESDLLEQIRVMSKEVTELEKECFEMRLVDEDGDPLEASNERWKTFTESDEDEVQPHPSPYSQYSLLLPEDQILNIEPDQKVVEEPLKQPAMQFTLRLNIWLLRKLQASTWEVQLLAYIISHHNGKLSKKIQQAILDHWFTDTEDTPTPGMYQPSRSLSMRTQAPRHPEIVEQLGLSPNSLSFHNSSQGLSRSQMMRGFNNTNETELAEVLGGTEDFRIITEDSLS